MSAIQQMLMSVVGKKLMVIGEPSIFESADGGNSNYGTAVTIEVKQ